jgi:hypothetical protein
MINEAPNHELIINSPDGRNLLVPAIMKTMHLVVERLLELKADPNKPDACPRPSATGENKVRYFMPLDTAASRSTANMVEVLLKAGADPNPQADGESLLVSSIRSNTDVNEKVRILIEAKADVNGKCREELSVTHVVDTNGNWQRTALNVNKAPEINVNSVDFNETTPLMAAATHSLSNLTALNAVMALLDANADVNLLDKYGRGALQMSMSNPVVFHILRRRGARVTDLMKDKVNKVSPRTGLTPLMEAVSNASPNRVNVLIAARANINAETADGVSVLMMALSYDYEIFRSLVLAGARITPELRGRAIELNDLNWFNWAEEQARLISLRNQLG